MPIYKIQNFVAKDQHFPPGHIKQFRQRVRSWRRIFREHGLDVLKVIPDRWHAVKWRYGSPRGAWSLLKGLALEAAWRLLPLVWEYQFIFLLERAPSRSTPATGR